MRPLLRLRPVLLPAALLLAAAASQAQQPWREYPSMEDYYGGRVAAPPSLPAEFVVGRLM